MEMLLLQGMKMAETRASEAMIISQLSELENFWDEAMAL
jgi:hypothetical protein